LQFSSRGAFQKNIDYIFKTTTKTTISFLRSEFFRISLDISKNFRFISNATREKDVGFEFKEKSKNDDLDVIKKPHEAGPKLIRYLLNGPFNDLQPSFNKIEIMLFCGDKKRGWRSLNEIGVYPSRDNRIDVEDGYDFKYFIMLESRPKPPPVTTYSGRNKKTEMMMQSFLYDQAKK